MYRALNLFLLVLTVHGSSLAQTHEPTKWWDPAQSEFAVIEGKAWYGQTEEPYDRLPAKAKANVREAVWNLSKHASGLMIRFRTNSKHIMVRYTVSGPHAMNHMPATGVSGVDLYAIDSDGQWHWSRAGREFSDTVVYSFQGLKENDNYHQLGREYRLYLPLYNHVNWLEIGVAEQSYFKPLPVRLEKPIVVYGTSIAHGACASRPGMSWANIVSRKLDRPLINLGFSGNGRLEPELAQLLAEIEAKVFVIDCLPNLTNAELYPDAELRQRIESTIDHLRHQRPEVPILLVDHAGYTDGSLHPDRKQAYSRVNSIQKQVYQDRTKLGDSLLFYLSNEDINLGMDDMVDGTHPNDLGMMHYATAYEQALREVLDEPIGSTSTTWPVIQYREPGNYDWENRHREILLRNRTSPPKSVILANSIIHFWGGEPKTKIAREPASWDEFFTPLGVSNLAYGWDRIENVIWRIYHDELAGFAAEKVVVMIGTNNLHLNSDEEILAGLDMLLSAIDSRQPKADKILMGLMPRKGYEARIKSLNLDINKLADNFGIQYADIGHLFLDADHTINEALFSDGLHPNEQGYLKMRESMKTILEP